MAITVISVRVRITERDPSTRRLESRVWVTTTGINCLGNCSDDRWSCNLKESTASYRDVDSVELSVISGRENSYRLQLQRLPEVGQFKNRSFFESFGKCSSKNDASITGE